MAQAHSYTPEEIAQVVLGDGGELAVLREIVLRIHGTATGSYSNTDPEKLRRQIGQMCEAVIQKSPVMSGFLGRPGGDASRDILGENRGLDGPPAF